jgi:hypothetical protein
MLCGEDREGVAVFPTPPATWNGFNNFADVCAECAASPKGRTRLRIPTSANRAAPPADAAAPAEVSQVRITISHRRTGVTLLTVDARTLARATMTGAALSGADLQHADLSGADLGRADLRLADLSGATLRGADLRRANLRGADLRGADLSSAKLHQTDLQSARYDRRTGWPADFDPRSSGALME